MNDDKLDQAKKLKDEIARAEYMLTFWDIGNPFSEEKLSKSAQDYINSVSIPIYALPASFLNAFKYAAISMVNQKLHELEEEYKNL